MVPLNLALRSDSAVVPAFVSLLVESSNTHDTKEQMATKSSVYGSEGFLHQLHPPAYVLLAIPRVDVGKRIQFGSFSLSARPKTFQSRVTAP